MRSYTCIVNQRVDGKWVAYYPTLEQIPPIIADSKRLAKRQSFQTLILFLHECLRQGKPFPKDTSTTYFHRVDLNRLHRYPIRQKEPRDYSLR